MSKGIFSIKVDMIGKRFGRLVVVKETEKRGKEYWWECLCDCGNSSIVVGGALRSGHTQSCGCLKKERITKHGIWGTPTYWSWNNMLQRCNNPKATKFLNHGGRGITVCEKWLKFTNFLNDMGVKPEGLTIERKDNELGYYKDNCKWATYVEQNRNQRISKRNKTGTTGVCWSKQKQKYRVRITANKHEICLGFFNKLQQAIEARKQGEQTYWR